MTSTHTSPNTSETTESSTRCSRFAWDSMRPVDMITSPFIRPCGLFLFRCFAFLWQLVGAIYILAERQHSSQKVHIAITLSFLSDAFNCIYFGYVVYVSLVTARYVLDEVNEQPDPIPNPNDRTTPTRGMSIGDYPTTRRRGSTWVRAMYITHAEVEEGLDYAQAETLTWVNKLAWVGLQILVTTSLIVTTVYWVFIASTQVSGTYKFSSLHMHVFNIVLMFLEFFLSRWKFVAWHVVFVIAITFIYMGIMLIHYARTGYFVYAMLDWSKHPVSAPILWFCLLAAIPLIFLVLVQVAKLRDYIASRIESRDTLRRANEIGLTEFSGRNDASLLSNSYMTGESKTGFQSLSEVRYT